MSNMGKGAGYYLTRSKSLLIDTAIVAILAIFMSFAMQMDALQSKGEDYLVLILSVLYSAFINVLILWIRNMNWFKSIPIFATLLHILLVVLKCGIFMKTNNVWVLLLFSPVSIIVLTACGLCLMTKERIVSSYY